jgi:putative metalloprotease
MLPSAPPFGSKGVDFSPVRPRAVAATRVAVYHPAPRRRRTAHEGRAAMRASRSTWGCALALVLSAGATAALHAADLNLGRALGAAADLGKAATVSDDDVRSYARQMRAYEERSREKVAAPGSRHAQRLAKLTDRYRSYDGLQLNFKVYERNAVNANASADGSIRVYTGLMDMMTDDELLFVIGHEIGHVKGGHSAKAMRTALTARGLRQAAAATNSTVSTLAESQLGGLLESVVNAQHSQGQETESDDYGMRFLKANKLDPNAAASSLRKLAKLSGGGGASILSSHPDPGRRADRMATAK